MQKENRALESALRSLSARAHTEKELSDKLERRGYDEYEIAKTMETLQRYELLNDSEFAAQWAASRTRKGYGQRRIAQELARKGVKYEEVQAALEGIDEEKELEKARELAEKQLQRGGENARKRAYDQLLRRGYSYDLAKAALEAALRSMEETEDFEEDDRYI